MKIEYTDSAKKIIDNYLEENKKNIEQTIINKKYVFGDEELIISDEDVRSAFIRQRIRERNNLMLSLITIIYSFIGILLILYGIFHKKIITFIYEDPIGFYSIFGGIILIFITLIMKFVLSKKRNNKRMSYYNKNNY